MRRMDAQGCQDQRDTSLGSEAPDRELAKCVMSVCSMARKLSTCWWDVLLEKARHLAMQSTQELRGEIDVIKRKRYPCRIPVRSTARKQLG